VDRITLTLVLGISLLFFGCDEPALVAPTESAADSLASAPAETHGDLTIGYIQRLPIIDYVWGSGNPAVDGWPAVGQDVTWQAHVKNWANEDLQRVGYAWYLDGEHVGSGTVDIPAESEVTIDYPWSWTFDRHVIELEVDPEDRVDEEEEKNNSLSIYTDAITVGFTVEQGMYDYFRMHQRDLDTSLGGLEQGEEEYFRLGSNSFEDWAQRQIRIWNSMAEQAIYEETPEGVLDRFRIDKIAIVPNGTLTGFAVPNENDRSVDLQWAIPADFDVGAGCVVNQFGDSQTRGMNNAFVYDGVMFHEVGHARYLIDLYAFDVFHDQAANWLDTPRGRRLQSGWWIDIREDGELVAGSKYMPFRTQNGEVYRNPEQGLMNRGYGRIDRYSAVALNRIAGHRATHGNVNPPQNIGEFMEDLPKRNRVTVRDQSGNALAGAKVSLYQHGSPGYYGKYYDDEPDLEYVADDIGQIELPKDPFLVREITTIVFPLGEEFPLEQVRPAVLIVRVEHEARVGYGFLPGYMFNLEYWRGHTELGEYEIQVRLFE
jgi:hypothetical protein